MDALSRHFLLASQQFVALADPEILTSRAKNLLAATLIAMSASAAIFPTEAAAWGEPANSDALPQQSASQWGGMLGGVLGKALGASFGGSQVSEVSRMVQTVVSGVGLEVGRNLGSQAAQAPYVAAKAGNYGGTSSYGHNSFASMPGYEKDHLDTLGLRAIFSNGDAVKAMHSQSAQLQQDRSYSTTRDFEMGLRASSDRGFDVTGWSDARGALQQPLRSVPEAKFAELASGMAQRLQRPGGPGFSMNASSVNSLDSLRSRMEKGQGLTYQQVGMSPR